MTRLQPSSKLLQLLNGTQQYTHSFLWTRTKESAATHQLNSSSWLHVGSQPTTSTRWNTSAKKISFLVSPNLLRWSLTAAHLVGGQSLSRGDLLVCLSSGQLSLLWRVFLLLLFWLRREMLTVKARELQQGKELEVSNFRSSAYAAEEPLPKFTLLLRMRCPVKELSS